MAKLDPGKKQFKPSAALVKELDQEEGLVVAYANVYGNEDWDGDISAPGSFTKSVDERFGKLRVFKNHNSDIELGVPNDKPDTKDVFGLLTYTQFNMEKEVSRDMFSDIKLKMKYKKDVDLSIGYNVVKRDSKNKNKIVEYALWEYSFLTNWGANPLATVVDAKNFKTETERQNSVITFLTDAYDLKYSDERLIKIEKLLKSLTEEPRSKPLIKEPTDSEIKSLILNSFKTS